MLLLIENRYSQRQEKNNTFRCSESCVNLTLDNAEKTRRLIIANIKGKLAAQQTPDLGSTMKSIIAVLALVATLQVNKSFIFTLDADSLLSTLLLELLRMYVCYVLTLDIAMIPLQ